MFNYGDIIEYVDGTYDENFNNARKWANSNRATFNELIDMRKEIDGVLHRFYEIKEIIVPEPTAEELKQARIAELKAQLVASDYVANKLIEAYALNDMELFETYRTKYKDKIQERKEMRAKIDELEEML